MWVDDELWLDAGRWVSRLAPHYGTIITANELIPLSQNCLPIEFAHILDPDACAIVVPIGDIDRLPLSWISELDTFCVLHADASFVVLAKRNASEFEVREPHPELLAVRQRILESGAVRANHVDRDLSSATDGEPYGLLITASMTGNCGDKLLAAAAVDLLHQANPDLKWIVADPAVDRQLVARSAVVALGPGGYLYDLHNFEGNTLYYQNIGNFFRFGFLAQEYGKPLISLGLGYQGVVSKMTAKYVSRSLSRALLITTRDTETARFVVDHLAPSPALISGDDFSLQFRETLASLARSRPSSTPYIALCGNAPFSQSDTGLIAAACQAKGMGVHLIIQAAEDVNSCEDCLRQLKALGADAKIVDLRQSLHTEFMAEIAHSSAVITSRFHGMMLGYMSNLPVFVKGELGDKRHSFYSTVPSEETFVFGNSAVIVDAIQSSISRSPAVPDRPLAQQQAGIGNIRMLVQAALSPAFLETCPPRAKMQLTPISSGPMETTLDQRQQLDDMSSKIARLKSLVNEESQPNINALSEAIRNVNVLALNVKFFGYELARALAAALPVRENLSPTSVSLKSKPSTQADLESDWVAYWSSKLKVPVIFHRKLWELCYAMQAFHNAGVLAEGKRGLGFGCGTEPLPSLMASYGAEVVVTDLQPDAQNTKGWADTNQHTKTLDEAFKDHLVSKDVFDRKVSLEYVDMNAIPDHLRDFDFCWSICALEHLGSIEKGLNFIENSIDVLKPGGVAVHTTEFNFTRDDITFDHWNTVLFQRKHFTEIAERLTAKGYKVAPLDFDVGNKPLDKFIDVPPFPHDMGDYMREIWGSDNNHIKVSVDGIPATCFGLIITK